MQDCSAALYCSPSQRGLLLPPQFVHQNSSHGVEMLVGIY